MAGHSTIAQVDFLLASDEDNRAASFVQVESCELFQPSGEPVKGGVYDLRMGTIDHSITCVTCSHAKKQCPGHRGSVELRAGVCQPLAIAEVRRWLKLACHRCGALVADRDKLAQVPLGHRLAAAAAGATEGRGCARCGAVQPRIAKDPEDHFTFLAEPPAERGRRGRGAKLQPDAIRAIFERVAEADVAALGRPPASHPRHLVMRVLPVPPNTVRPSVRHFGSAGSSYHDSTNLIQHIVRKNSQLPLPGGGPGAPADPGALERGLTNYQQLVFDLIRGSQSTSAVQGNSGKRGLVVGPRPLHSFLKNLSQKGGRIRANLLGGRVFYVSRSTISGNTRFRLDEVGVPLEFARTLQVEEVVQEANRDRLLPFFLNGRRGYPGSTLLRRRATGELHDVALLRDLTLENGDVLWRDVVTGDRVIFGRQPTLEISSIGSHRAVVTTDPSIGTFQFNVLACENYNADFDGDQMYLIVPHGAGPRAEVGVVSDVSNAFFSVKTGGPVNGQVQDSTLGCAELTRDGVELDRFHAVDLFATAGLAELPGFGAAGRFSGREVASLVLAAAPVDYRRPPTSFSEVYAPFLAYPPGETLTVVERGRLVSGVLDARAIGAKAAGGLFHLIGREHGAKRALDLIFSLQQVALRFLATRGFTVGAADLLPGPRARGEIGALAARVLADADLVTDGLLRGELVPPIGETVRSHYERLMINALGLPEAEVLRWILHDLRPASNGLLRMILTGAKGKNPNLFHIAGKIGQTLINGERIREQFAFRRTLPYFPRYDTSPAAGGWINSGYMEGMKASEVFFQAMSGRFDLINKTLSTSTTGHFMRKGVMNNQSSLIDNHRRVSKNAAVVQFLFGDDGLDPRRLERVELRSVALGDAALGAAFGLDLAAGGAAGGPTAVAAAQAAVDAAVARIRADRDRFRATMARLEDACFDFSGSAEALLPVNLRRTVEGLALAARGRPPPPLDAAALAAKIARVEDTCERLPYTLLNEIQERRRAPVPARFEAAVGLLAMHVRLELAPAVLARLSPEELDFAIDVLRGRHGLALASYGLAVGVIAAQAVCEPLTQYMLDSHHRSVGGGTSKDSLQRVSEVYGARGVASERLAAMQLPLRLAELDADDPSPEAAARASALLGQAQAIANSIEHITLRRLVAGFDLLLEARGALVYPPFTGDAGWLAEFDAAHPLVRPPSDLTPWCLRFVLDKSQLALKDIALELVVARLRERAPQAFVTHTSEAVPEVVLRVWARAGAFRRGGDEEAAARDLGETLLGTPIRGVPGVLRASARFVDRRRAGPGGALALKRSFVVATTGTNLYGAVLHGAVDARRAISTSVADTAGILGIEAARAKIVSETRTLLADSAPTIRHIELYADEMTRTGRVTSFERGGLASREPQNTMLGMAFGDPVKALESATLAGARNTVYGIAAPMMLGALPRVGSTFNALVADEAFCAANLRTLESALEAL